MSRLVLAAAGVWLLLAPTAHADQQIVATAPYRFATPTVTMAQGERVMFVNQDVAGHDVTAKDKGPDDKPLFGSDLQQQGKEGEVRLRRAAHDAAKPVPLLGAPEHDGQARRHVCGDAAAATRDGPCRQRRRAVQGRRIGRRPAGRARRARAGGSRSCVAVDQAAIVELAVRVRGGGGW